MRRLRHTPHALSFTTSSIIASQLNCAIQIHNTNSTNNLALLQSLPITTHARSRIAHNVVRPHGHREGRRADAVRSRAHRHAAAQAGSRAARRYAILPLTPEHTLTCRSLSHPGRKHLAAHLDRDSQEKRAQHTRHHARRQDPVWAEHPGGRYGR